GLVPAAAGQAERRGRELALHRAFRALRAGIRIGIRQLLQTIELVATGSALESVDGHGVRLETLRGKRNRPRCGGGFRHFKPLPGGLSSPRAWAGSPPVGSGRTRPGTGGPAGSARLRGAPVRTGSAGRARSPSPTRWWSRRPGPRGRTARSTP